VARRLRALNITTWIASAVSGGYVIVNLYTSLWSEAMINLIAGLLFGAIPLLHSFSPLAAAFIFMIVLYVDLFILVFLLGTGAGMYFYSLLSSELSVLFFGTEHIFLAAVFGALAAALIVVLQVLVPSIRGSGP
jgi:adenylate cyclase